VSDEPNENETMKLGIAFIVIGVGLIFLSVPYAISTIIGGVFHSTAGTLPSGALSVAGFVGIFAGIVLIGIGATRIFK
jgi:hypothetical protein